MSTENGISKFIPEEERFENYADGHVSPHVRFSEAASAYTSWGDLLFGTSNGVLLFNPDSIRKSTYVPPLVFSKLLIANEDVVPDEKNILKESLDDTRELQLSHEENIFTIRFAALDYTEPAGIQYAYILEGFEKSWNYVGKQRTATYTNLPKGHYVFKVRATNADGVWTDNMRLLDIEVLPSFWETPFAYFLYVLFVLLIIITAVYILFTIYRLKHEVVVEQHMTDMKLRFFTDISHELRTPLTLISGPVEYVLEHTQLPADARLDSGTFEVINGKIDWYGLSQMVGKSDMPDKETVLNILSVTPVEGSSGKRGRKNELMYLKAGVPYRYMLKNFFPALRSSTCIKVFYEKK